MVKKQSSKRSRRVHTQVPKDDDLQSRFQNGGDQGTADSSSPSPATDRTVTESSSPTSSTATHRDDWDSETALERVNFFEDVIRKPGCVEGLKGRLRNILKVDSVPLEEGAYSVRVLQIMISDLRRSGRLLEALELARWAYELATLQQIYHFYDPGLPRVHAVKRARRHKGHLLHQIVTVLDELEWRWHAAHFLMLTTVEDFLTYFFLRASYERKVWRRLGIAPSADYLGLAEPSGDDPFEAKPYADLFEKYAAETGAFDALTRKYAVPEERVQAWIRQVAVRVFGFLTGKMYVGNQASTADNTGGLSLGSEKKFDGWKGTEFWGERLFPLLGCEGGRGAAWPDAMVMFPEWVAGRIGLENALLELPSAYELDTYVINRPYGLFLSRLLYEGGSAGLEGQRRHSHPGGVQEDLRDATLKRDHVFEEIAR